MLVSIPFSFVPSTTIVSSQMNSNFTAISDWANGNIGADNIGVIEDELQWNITGTVGAIDITSDSSIPAVRIQSSVGKALEIVAVAGTLACLDGQWKWETVNTTDLSWTSNLALAASVGGDELTLALRAADNTAHSSTKIGYAAFRAASATSGVPTTARVSVPTSIVLPSGATLGLRNNQNYCYLYLLNNAGTIELAVSAAQLDVTNLHSTTAISGTATSNRVLYSTASRTNVAIRLIGKITCPQTVSGVYAAAPTKVVFGAVPNEPVIVTASTNSGASVGFFVDTTIIFDSAVNDATASYDPLTGEFTAPTSGNYNIFGNIALAGTLTATTVTSQIRVNGVDITTFQSAHFFNGNAYGPVAQYLGILPLVAGDVVTIAASADLVTGLDTNIPNRTTLNIVQVS